MFLSFFKSLIRIDEPPVCYEAVQMSRRSACESSLRKLSCSCLPSFQLDAYRLIAAEKSSTLSTIEIKPNYTVQGGVIEFHYVEVLFFLNRDHSLNERNTNVKEAGKRQIYTKD